MIVKFKRSDFHPQRNKIKSQNLHKISFSNNFKKINIKNNFLINEISSIDQIRNNSIIFLEKNFDINANFNNLLIVTSSKKIFNEKKYINKILVKNLNEAYINFINELFYHEDNNDFDDKLLPKNNSFISSFSKIDNSSKIGSNCVIGRGVIVGKNCIIKNNVTIKNTIISDNVIIGDNSIIGSTGFGFDLSKLGSINLSPHIGIVYLDTNVRIGSNCSIDRGKIDLTYIGKNSMLDNLVHVAHNVHISDNACIAAQTGISGSVKIGSNSIIGGQVGLAGHINIGNNVIIAAKSGVTKNINDNSTIAGFPATDIKLWKKKIINQRRYGHKPNSKDITS